MTYDTFQAVLSFLRCHVLHLPDAQVCIDSFVAHNKIVRKYTKNLVIRHTLIIRCIIFCLNHL